MGCVVLVRILYCSTLPMVNKTYYTSQREIWRDISRAEGEYVLAGYVLAG